MTSASAARATYVSANTTLQLAAGEFYEDITEAHEQSERLKLAATVFRSTQEGVVITDPQGRVMALNPAFERITEYRESDVMGLNLRLLSSGRHERAFFQNLWRELL